MAYKMKYRKPNVGETVHCWVDGAKYIAHHHMLYLGPDKKSKDNLLVPSKEHGFAIISLSGLSQGNFRPLGRYNLVEEVVTKKLEKVTGFTYRFYDNRKELDIKVKLFRGNWKIVTKFDPPSWMIKEEPEKKDA